jgi:hypothetical protein
MKGTPRGTPISRRRFVRLAGLAAGTGLASAWDITSPRR